MPVLKPFKAIHPNDKNMSAFPSRQIENYTDEEIKHKIHGIQDSVLQLVAPTFEKDWTQEEKYKKVRKNFVKALSDGTLVADGNSSFYIYQQTNANESYTGIIGLFNVNDVEKQAIRIHENTLRSRKQIFADYLSEVHIQSEPILLTYPENQRVDVLMQKQMKSKVLLHYTDETKTEHKVWRVSDRAMLANFKEAFEKMEAVYIADGHHRLGSTQMYAEAQKEKNNNHFGHEPYNYVLGFALSDKTLKIHDFNRLVTDLNGMTTAQFLEKLTEKFTVVEKDEKPYFPSHKHHISMYVDGKFYGLYFKHELRGTPEGLGELDTFLFEEIIAKPMFNIHDSTTDKRINFIKGTKDLNGILKIKEQVDSGKYKIGFGFYPINFKDLKLISDLQLKMPPKSTYITPKLLTGLLMYNMEK